MIADVAIAAASGLTAMPGEVALDNNGINCDRGGRNLALLVDTAIPGATEEILEFSGLITVGGFLLAFI
ncbi:hypothetical protein [Pseudomonas sp.]|uniref:hypothetical protein n=1 Tax=Pseudomonas sp. TaxID=306 RepID=UPI0025E9AF6E|nr:hypothetical protein [Pseudomonas sp.]